MLQFAEEAGTRNFSTLKHLNDHASGVMEESQWPVLAGLLVRK